MLSIYMKAWKAEDSAKKWDYLPVPNFSTCGVTKHGEPEIFKTDQGSQFTSEAFTSVLLDKQISISMDGRGRALDNVFIERLWWTVKYEDIYPKAYEQGKELYKGLSDYFPHYNDERKHSALDKRTPSEVFFETCARTIG